MPATEGAEGPQRTDQPVPDPSDPVPEPAPEPASEPATRAEAKAEATKPETKPVKEPATEPEEKVSFLEAVGPWSGWLWAVGGPFAALLLWWPFSYAGSADFLTLPPGLARLGLVFLGALTASALTAMLVRSPWPRFVIAVGFPLACLLRTGAGGYPVVALVTFGVLVLLGIALGAWATATVGRFAVVLALVVGLVPAPHLWWGPFLAVALALPFVRATASRVAPTVLGVVGVLVAWVVGTLVRATLPTGFAGSGRRSGLDLLEQGGKGTWTALRDQGSGLAGDALASGTGWYVLAAALAVVVVLVRSITGGVRARRAAA